jgi:hypothetical protein
MRKLTWLVALVSACSSTSSPSQPDAREEEDPVDARARADARQQPDAPPGSLADASMSMADAAPGSADARPDATPGTPDAAVLTVRPWNGGTAKLRLIDLRMIGTSVGVKLCVFDDDADPRPYSVLVTRGFSSSGDTTIEASYVDVPAAAGLRASVHTFVLAGAQQPDTTPAGCNAAAATELRDGQGFSASAFYTATYDETDAASAQCETSGEDGCQFYPQWDGAAASQCAKSGLRVFRDGHLGPGGYRLINMTADAALLSHTPSLGDQRALRHVDIPFFFDDYEETIPGDLTFICPDYVECMGADLSVNPFTECTTENTDWIVGEIQSSRISDDTKFTTFYLVGDVRDLASDESGLVGPSVTVVTAHDRAN